MFLSCVVCLQVSLGVAALFGPHDAAISHHVDCICSRLEIPHIITGLEWSSNRGQWRDDRLFTVNVHPAGRQLSSLYVDLIRLFHWNAFCVVVANSHGRIVVPLQYLLLNCFSFVAEHCHCLQSSIGVIMRRLSVCLSVMTLRQLVS